MYTREKMKLLIRKATQYTLSSVHHVSITPLNIAIVFLSKHMIMYGIDIIQTLVNACIASVGVADLSSFYTPLHQIVMRNAFSEITLEKIYQFSLKVIQLFIKAWPDVLIMKDADGHTPLDIVLNATPLHTHNTRMNHVVEILSKSSLDIYQVNHLSRN